MKRLLLAGCALVLAATGCTATPPPRHEQEKPPAVALPADRDPRAVLSALRRIDLCAVLDRGATTAGIEGHTVRAVSPFACDLDFAEPRSFPVHLRVDPLPSGSRVTLPSTVIGGARAYVFSDGPCDVVLPVTFTVSIEIMDTGRSCAEAQPLLAGVVSALGDPDRVTTEPRWTACEVLSTAAVGHPSTDLGLDGCSDVPGKRGLWFDYPESFPRPKAQRGKAGDRSVWVSTDPSDSTCDVSWKPDDGPLAIIVRAATCDEALAMVAPVDRVLRQPPPEARPQRPLLYGPDEPDSPFAGACAYIDGLGSPEQCAPLTRVPIPGAGQQLVDLAADDVQVACSLALDPVTEHFGDQMRAVIVMTGDTPFCYLVTPRRQLEIGFTVSRSTVADERRDGARTTDIAGHRALVADCDVILCSVSVATSTDAEQQGVLSVTIRRGPLRGAEVPGDAGDKAQAVLGDIVRKHFG
ncbi:hypothetical protein BLA60_40270 [Actinophytocola xinjiangensis]|uniref:DUF3558 domain-containing protein n=1 Tax=Actinophytocola xinjiangensis TaxID=485602 RepID=A0A7Z0WCW9_9PSEU|nr:hypothetical protein [Actinophytocola xinjiangensis]OLF04529.1 hypothetical protein BLA60_40270 [Actinophytocola xinjiangensis]